MKIKVTRILSGIMAVLLLFMLCVPVLASSSSVYNQKVGFWTWLTGKDSILPDFIGRAAGTICPNSEDSYHHASNYQVDKENGYYRCICSYCGRLFTAYESDLQQSYTDYTASLPATGYTSDNALLYTVPVDNVYTAGSKNNLPFYGCIHYNSTLPTEYDMIVDENNHSVLLQSHYGNSCLDHEYIERYFYCTYSFEAPIAGTYFFDSGTYCLYYVRVDGTSETRYCDIVGDDVGFLNSGVSNKFLLVSDSFYFIGIYLLNFIPSSIVYRIEPFVADLPEIENIYNTTTRPTSITGGNYGIIGDDGELTIINGDIINETNNTYYNPVTSQGDTITNWSYDYSDRSYNLTLESGDTVSVTYGDQNITIVEGGDTYIIYYIIEGSGSGSGSEPGESHTHEWNQTDYREGNCLTPTQRTYTCSVCGEQYTETDPVLGHSWRIIQEVSTRYDESGKLIQEGFTIFECERCGEQYKSTNDTGPPASGGSSSGGGSGSGGGNIFSGIFGIFADFLRFFFDFFADFVVGGIKDFISALLDAGSDFFSILNPFDWGY